MKPIKDLTDRHFLSHRYIYCHSKLLKLGAGQAFGTRQSVCRRQVSKSMIFASPKPQEKDKRFQVGGEGGIDTLATMEADACESFEEELILMDTEAAVAAAREAAAIAESAMHAEDQPGSQQPVTPRSKAAGAQVSHVFRLSPPLSIRIPSLIILSKK